MTRHEQRKQTLRQWGYTVVEIIGIVAICGCVGLLFAVSFPILICQAIASGGLKIYKGGKKK